MSAPRQTKAERAEAFAEQNRICAEIILQNIACYVSAVFRSCGAAWCSIVIARRSRRGGG
jgi:hypothetical protein